MTTITWTPITERLPDADQTVLVWTKGGEWFAAWYDDEDTGWRDGCTTVQMQGDNEVTHLAEPQGPGELQR